MNTVWYFIDNAVGFYSVNVFYNISGLNNIKGIAVLSLAKIGDIALFFTTDLDTNIEYTSEAPITAIGIGNHPSIDLLIMKQTNSNTVTTVATSANKYPSIVPNFFVSIF